MIPMCSIDELTSYAAEFLEENFNVQLSIPIQRNNRLRSTLGRYVMEANGRPKRIELSGNLLNYGSKESIHGVLRHECIHYAFHIRGKNMQDGTPEFEQALEEFNAPSSNTLKIGKYYIYECLHCNKRGESRIKRIAQFPNNYRTNCCKSKLSIIGVKIYDGYK